MESAVSRNRGTLTRRTFLGTTAAAAGAALALRALPMYAEGIGTEECSSRGAPGVPRDAPRAVVSFFADLPYLDGTGTAMPYVRLGGASATACNPALLEQALLSRYGFV
jgi:hypothetical protein